MRKRILRYLRERSRDPSAWLALAFIVPIAAGAVLGLSLVGFWNLVQGISISLAVLEWAHLLRARSRGVPLPHEPLVVLSPPTDRWKAAWMVPVSVVLLIAEVGMDRVLGGGSVLNFGLTALGVSTFVSLWYAWSLPVRVTPRGVLVGTGLVPWAGVDEVALTGEGAMRIQFGGPGHFWYGSKVSAAVTGHQLDELTPLVPADLASPEALPTFERGAP